MDGELLPLLLEDSGFRWTFDAPLFLTTYPYTADWMGACSAKGEWSLSSLPLSLLSLSPLYTVLPRVQRARKWLDGDVREILPLLLLQGSVTDD